MRTGGTGRQSNGVRATSVGCEVSAPGARAYSDPACPRSVTRTGHFRARIVAGRGRGWTPKKRGLKKRCQVQFRVFFGVGEGSRCWRRSGVSDGVVKARLFCVAMTRATEHLVMASARNSTFSTASQAPAALRWAIEEALAHSGVSGCKADLHRPTQLVGKGHQHVQTELVGFAAHQVRHAALADA